MTWKSITPELVTACTSMVEAFSHAPRELWGDHIVLGYGDLADMLILWIDTVREAQKDHAFYGPEWLPTVSDFYKSALFERIRSGKAPLPEPPPIGLACPWYAVVEDPGPHYVIDIACRVPGDAGLGANDIVLLQNGYTIVEVRGDQDYVVRDTYPETSYRFRLWYDPEYIRRGWCAPGYEMPKGGWMLQNMEFHSE